jgi:N-acetylglucosamine malate deacetylase 1
MQNLFFFLFLIFCLSVKAQKVVVVITPHPDDAEASCGGYIANAVTAGDKVVILTMTGGEYGIQGKSPMDAKKIREQEAKNGASILKTKIEFFGSSDAFLPVDTITVRKLTAIIQRLHPDIVLAPWPLDVHNDHQSSGLLAWRVFQDKEFSFKLFFYETINEPHTKSFAFVPTDYVDISDVFDVKEKAVLAHVSQNPSAWYNQYITLAAVRGYEADVKYAEAYIEAKNSSCMGGRENKVSKTLN